MKKLIIILLLSFSTQLFSQSIVWRQILAGSLDEKGYNAIELKDKGFLLVGFKIVPQIGTGFLLPQTYLVKFDKYGNIEWEHVHGDSLLNNTAVSAVEDPDGNIYIPYNGSNVHLMKMDPGGNILWDISYPEEIEFFRGVSFSDDYKNLVILSQSRFQGPPNIPTASLTKLDSSGNLIWNKLFYNTSPSISAFTNGNNSFHFTDKDYYISGASSSTGFILKTDTSGKEIWRKFFTQVRGIYSIAPNSENTFIAAAQFGPGYLYCIKFDQNGDTIWQRNYQNDPLVHPAGYNKIVKIYNGNFTLGTVCGGNFGRIVIIDSLGNYVFSNSYPYPQDYLVCQTNLNTTSDSGFIVTGDIGIKPITDSYPIDALIYKIDKHGNTVSINNNQTRLKEFNISLYPNPYNLSFKIELRLERNSNVRIELFDIAGKTVKVIENSGLNAGEYRYNVSTPESSSGVYFVRANAVGKIFSKKILLIK